MLLGTMWLLFDGTFRFWESARCWVQQGWFLWYPCKKLGFLDFLTSKIEQFSSSSVATHTNDCEHSRDSFAVNQACSLYPNYVSCQLWSTGLELFWPTLDHFPPRSPSNFAVLESVRRLRISCFLDTLPRGHGITWLGHFDDRNHVDGSQCVLVSRHWCISCSSCLRVHRPSFRVRSEPTGSVPFRTRFVFGLKRND